MNCTLYKWTITCDQQWPALVCNWKNISQMEVFKKSLEQNNILKKMNNICDCVKWAFVMQYLPYYMLNCKVQLADSNAG